MPFEFNNVAVFGITRLCNDHQQGQSLQVCGLNFSNPCFLHGQLYVACSQVGAPSDLFVYAPEGRTKNIVHPNAIQ
ncbi:ATP-dependent DNA helicase [Aphis craccivora]|uniref:ATP-dependent DNA helicase n=1 Tax=Aphis craccivora TaxID=307492 RepID=A0A6G0Z328_APHCR|nr:ATP-dependent DNA helicase [Aphis craccivora]